LCGISGWGTLDGIYLSGSHILKVNESTLTRDGFQSEVKDPNPHTPELLRLALFREVPSSGKEIQRLVAAAIERTVHASSAFAAETLDSGSATPSLTADFVNAFSNTWSLPEGWSNSELRDSDTSVVDDNICETHPEVDNDIYEIQRAPSHDYPPKSSVLLKNHCCDKCLKTYSSARALKWHQKSHTKSIICDMCGYRCTWKKDLRRHMRTHKTLDQKTYYECPRPSCFSKSSRRDNLLRHLRAKHDLNPSQCIPKEVKIAKPTSGPHSATLQSTARAVPGRANYAHGTNEITATGSAQQHTGQSNPGAGPSSVQSNSSKSNASKDKGKRPRDSGKGEDGNREGDGSSSPPSSPSKRGKSEGRLICPFYYKDPIKYGKNTSCLKRGFGEISHLRKHLQEVHGQDCSKDCCNIGQDAPKYDDSRVAKWRAECKKHCHEDSECNHNPFNDGTENPTPTTDPSPRRRTSRSKARQVAESSQTPRLDYLLLQEMEMLKSEAREKDAKIEKLESEAQEKDETIQTLTQRALQAEFQLSKFQLSRFQVASLNDGYPQPTWDSRQVLWNSSPTDLQLSALIRNAAMKGDGTGRVVHASDRRAIDNPVPRRQLTQEVPTMQFYTESSGPSAALTTVDPRILWKITPPDSLPDLADVTTLVTSNEPPNYKPDNEESLETSNDTDLVWMNSTSGGEDKGESFAADSARFPAGLGGYDYSRTTY